MDEVVLTVGGRHYAGWEDVGITRSIEQLAGTFSLAVSDRWPGQSVRRPITAGQSASVSVNGESVITGYIDDVSSSIGGDSHQIGVSGRDVSGDLVDCSAAIASYHQRNLLQLARSVCDPFGIQVMALTDVGQAFENWTIQPGESVHETLRRAAGHRGVLLTSDGRGCLLIARAGTARAPAALVEGENILSASVSRSMRDRYSEYQVIGQTAGTDQWSGEVAAQVEARARDAGVGRYRLLIISAEDQAHQPQVRADFAKNVRIGKSAPATVTVQGWGEQGRLWHPNTRVELHAPSLDIHREMLIASVSFRKGERGTTTELKLALPGAYDLLPIPEKPDPVGEEWTQAD